MRSAMRSPKGSILLYSLFLSAFMAAFFTAFRFDLKNALSDSDSQSSVSEAVSTLSVAIVDAYYDPQSAFSKNDPFVFAPIGYDGRYFYRRISSGSPSRFTVSKDPTPGAIFRTYVAFGDPVRVSTFSPAGTKISESVATPLLERSDSVPPKGWIIELEAFGGIADVEIERLGSTLSDEAFGMNVSRTVGSRTISL